MQLRLVRFATDTATLLLCDPVRLTHRRSDDADWWCWPAQTQVQELNAGNAAFIDLGSDGEYELAIADAEMLDPELSMTLGCPSGRIFVGAGEEATCQVGEPECLRGGTFVSVPVGAVRASLKRFADRTLSIHIAPISEPAQNAFAHPLELK